MTLLNPSLKASICRPTPRTNVQSTTSWRENGMMSPNTNCDYPVKYPVPQVNYTTTNIVCAMYKDTCVLFPSSTVTYKAVKFHNYTMIHPVSSSQLLSLVYLSYSFIGTASDKSWEDKSGNDASLAS